MSDKTLFRIVFKGVLTGEYDLETTKKRFARTFHLDDNKAARLFSGKEYVLKDKVDEALAIKYAIKIAEAGGECYIETIPDENDPTARPGFIERRKGGDRRIRFRRPPRPGALVPDRRNNGGRRKEDLRKAAG
ncbi:MAG: hypothetical protein HUJ31_10335 [Pseudomonadales bacterium]|nr:hypothetical protein [Pseudomonadales bacterium]